VKGNALRRLAIATAAILSIGSFAVAPASASPPPESGVWYSCQTKAAGYSPSGAGTGTEAWVWDGRLQWEVCVARTSTGKHYAIVRLSAPADLIGKYDRYTGLSQIYLQRCATRSYVTVAQKDWAIEQYSTATKIGSRWQFTWLQTPSTTSTTTSYRVHIVAWNGAVVPRDGSFVFSLQPGGLTPVPGGEGVYNTGCLNP